MTGIGNQGPLLEGIPGPQPGRFLEVFGEGQKPRVFFAPGRVNLMGAHLDYNGGPVMPMAIDHGTWVSIRRTSDPVLALASDREPGVLLHHMGGLPSRPTGSWSDYPIGVLRRLTESGVAPSGGVQIHVGGNLPVGAGLSSSASLCVATALACATVWELEFTNSTLIDGALWAERVFVGMPCGIMDPISICEARSESLLWLDCGDESFCHLPMDSQRVGVAVAESGVSRQLRDSGYEERVAECSAALALLRGVQPGAKSLCDVERKTFERCFDQLTPTLQGRVEHVLSEQERTRRARTNLEEGRLEDLGACLFESHRSLRDDYQVSCPELDRLVEDARGVPGVLGSRLTGAGFGGCTVLLHERGTESQIEGALKEGFRSAFGREPRVWFFRGDPGPRELFAPK